MYLYQYTWGSNTANAKMWVYCSEWKKHIGTICYPQCYVLLVYLRMLCLHCIGSRSSRGMPAENTAGSRSSKRMIVENTAIKDEGGLYDLPFTSKLSTIRIFRYIPFLPCYGADCHCYSTHCCRRRCMEPCVQEEGEGNILSKNDNPRNTNEQEL